ncbi:MAG: hypothetical protein MJ138_04915 [Kiritimatiellae bacterium]|nr:hypothetical protein [Kiritimatiellia bacterium]
MNDDTSHLLLLGVGGMGAETVRALSRAYGPGIRVHAVDTDASIGADATIPFTLIGGSRLAGRGAGGHAASARAAVQDAPDQLDHVFDGVRLAVVVSALGGGTGGGATVEILKRLRARGVATLLFATKPFAFEGEEKRRAAQTAAAGVEQEADASVMLPLDDLTKNARSDVFKEAMADGARVLSEGLALLWRLLEKPGYVKLDAEQIVDALRDKGRARFAIASASGPDRVRKILDDLAASPLLAHTGARTREIMLGVLAGDDLRLSEVGTLADGARELLGRSAKFSIGTVNDESAYGGRIEAVVLAFDESSVSRNRKTGDQKALAQSGRIGGSDRNLWHDEDLDVPTYMRRHLTLDR